jgi:hypothetical protein
MRDESVSGPLDENGDDLQRETPKIARHDGLENQIVVDVSPRQRCDRNVCVDLNQFDVQALVFEIAFEPGDAAAQKRHVGVGNADVYLLRFGFFRPKGERGD